MLENSTHSGRLSLYTVDVFLFVLGDSFYVNRSGLERNSNSRKIGTTLQRCDFFLQIFVKLCLSYQPPHLNFVPSLRRGS